jgi:hypothetical protein
MYDFLLPLFSFVEFGFPYSYLNIHAHMECYEYSATIRRRRWLISLAPSLVDDELYLFGGTGHGLTGGHAACNALNLK